MRALQLHHRYHIHVLSCSNRPFSFFASFFPSTPQPFPEPGKLLEWQKDLLLVYQEPEAVGGNVGNLRIHSPSCRNAAVRLLKIP